MQHSRLTSFALGLFLSLAGVTNTASAQEFLVDFETLGGSPTAVFQGVPANAYASVGISSITVNSALNGVLLTRLAAPGGLALGHASFTQAVNIAFSPVVVSVTVDALDIGSGGVILEAFNSSDVVIASQSAPGADPPFLGIGRVDTLTVSAPGIVRVRVRQPGVDDGFLIDNIRFTRAVCGDGTLAPSETCDDGNTDPCDGCNATCTAVDVEGCFIGGSCVAEGAANPSNACQECVSATNATAYTAKTMGSACDDGQFCTLTEACNAMGQCVVSANRSCNDDLTCTNDSCDEVNDVCENVLTTGCLIDGACISSGARDSSDCQACVPGTSTSAYTPLAAATSCSDGMFCSVGDACDGSGTCTPTGMRDCADALSCTMDGCNEATDACENPITDGCVIAGQCVAQEANNPNNNCQACIPTVSRTAYSPKPAASVCDDGQFCTVSDQCDGNSVCAGTARACADSAACTDDTCNEATDQCDYTLTTGCLIGGVCVADGANNPSNECQACTPSSSTSAYSNKAAASACNDTLFCTTADTCDGNGVCVGGPARNCDDALACTTDTCDDDEDRCVRTINTGCRINNTCIADGTINVSNPCQVCNASLNQDDWSPTLLGTACDDGLFCTATDSCNGAGSCVGLMRDCSDAFSCTQDICNEATDACENPLVAGCIIDGACVPEGQDDPASPCRECVPATSTSAYSNRASGDRCGDPSCSNGTQTPAPTCDANGECVVNAPVSCNGAVCADSVSCTGTCTNDAQCLMGFFCNPLGMCVPDGDDGDPCMRGEMCLSGFCADGVCCNSACLGVCESCNQPALNGMCAPVAIGTDPQMECGVGRVCNGASIPMCIDEDRPNGEMCTDGLQCESGYCVDGVCCDALCNGTCESCALINTVGLCTPQPIGEDPEMECGENGFCNGASECAAYETRGSGVLCSVGNMTRDSIMGLLTMLLALGLLLSRRRSV